VAQYSLCGPGNATTWTIAVLHQTNGKGVSRHIHERLRPGDMVKVSGPRNHFAMTDAPSYLFIAGGIGITPFLPMIEQLDLLSRPWKLAYGGRRRAGMAFATRLARARTNVQLFAEDEVGLIPLAMLLAGAAPGCAVYCCGPEPLIGCVELWLKKNGRPPPRVERFSANPSSQSASHAFSVTLARSGITVEVPADRSIADVLDERNIFVPTSCREGVCGSCETRVVFGEVEHRDSLLTAQQRASGKTMMICISRAAGQSITLDL
jgi:ferredoxin-NADP reductase